jgi:hypothetical protein
VSTGVNITINGAGPNEDVSVDNGIASCDIDNNGINDIVIGAKNAPNGGRVHILFMPYTFTNGGYYIGHASDINSNYDNLSESVSGSNINITDDGIPIIEFNHYGNIVNFSDINLTNATAGGKGGIVISGVPLAEGYTKTAYVDAIWGKANVCVKDADITSIYQITGSCNGEDETLVVCPHDGYSHQTGIYNCTYLASIKKYKVEGLLHSGAQEYGPLGGGGSSVPEFSDYAIIFIILTAIAGFYFVKKEAK